MSRRIAALISLGALIAPLLSAHGQEADVRIAGPPSTNPLLTSVARAMKQQGGLRLGIITNMTNADALAALAHGNAGIALITRALTGEDRAQYPDVSLVAIPVGMQAVAIGVSSDVWSAGLQSISREVMRAIYEQKMTNWRGRGGPDETIAFFDVEQGQAVWEILADWLYGDSRKAGIPKVQTVASSQDARDVLEFTPGAVAPLAAVLVDGTRCHALGIVVAGRVVRPTPEEIASTAYPLVHPLVAVVLGRPTLSIRAVTEFLTGPAGQALVRKAGAFGLEAVPKP